MDEVLEQLATAVESDDLEALVRPFLSILERVSGLESTYMTRIDTDRGIQEILFARNSGDLTVAEGLTVPWGDTLCKRALEDDVIWATDVPTRWGDSAAAGELGLVTYVNEPVTIGDDRVYGTLCGASTARVPEAADARRLMRVFAKLIGRHIEREQLLETLRREHDSYRAFALTDPLTLIPNRRAMVSELNRALANAERRGEVLHLAFIDLDGFKQINDAYGHDAGDRFLIAIAEKLQNALRGGDFVARIGGDEFVVFGPCSSDAPDAGRRAMRERLSEVTSGEFDLGEARLDYAGPSIGAVNSSPGERDCETVLARADEAMYAIKRSRNRRRVVNG